MPRPEWFRGIPALILVGMLSMAAWSTAQTTTSRAASGPACALCSDQGRVKCPSCAGRGSRQIICPSCEGVGKFECPECRTSPAARQARLENPDLGAGYVSCTNRFCVKGRVANGEGSCKLCGGAARMTCRRCSGGQITCICGARPVTAPCTDCSGRGAVACPHCKTTADAKTCVICGGFKDICSLCATMAGKRSRCAPCDGKGQITCRACAGSAKAPCALCHTFGKVVRLERGEILWSGTAECPLCRGRGFAACTVCSSGREKCPACKDGFLQGRCGGCNQGHVVCGGCRGGLDGGLMTMAGILADDQRFDEALAYCDSAHGAVQRAIDTLTTEVSRGTPAAAPKGARPQPAGTIEERVLRAVALNEARQKLALKQVQLHRIEADLADLRAWAPRPRGE